MPPKPKGKGRAPKKHDLCATLPEKTLLTDLRKKTWRVGKAIGSGGFGLIYLADEGTSASVKDTASYVIKIEPESNGPLFCELAFYNRAARAEQIEEWNTAHKRSFIGVPKYIAQGRHEQNGETLRFMVMPRCGEDLHKLWLNADKSFRRATVSQIAIQMIDALEYIHSKDYIHADIKGSNILCSNEDPNKLYLVDYGLAIKYTTDKGHKEYKPDPRKAHNGTIEYTSSDAHLGASPSRRGDFEILGFVLLHWIAGRLPWEGNLTDCNKVRDQKIENMKNVKSFVKKLCPNNPPEEIIQLLTYAGNMRYDEDPDYNKLRNIFKAALKSLGVAFNSPLDFSSESSEVVAEPPRKLAKVKSKTKARSSKPLRSKTNNISLNESEEELAKNKVRRGVKRRSTDPAEKFAVNSSLSSEKESPASPKAMTKKSRVGKQQSTDFDDQHGTKSTSGSERETRKERKTTKSRTLKKQACVSSDESREEMSAESSDNEEYIPSPKRKKTTKKKTTLKKDFTPAAAKKKVDQKKRMKMSGRLRSSSSAAPESEPEEIKQDPSPKQDTDESSDCASTKIVEETKKKIRSSRYSMAPLHTQPVLTKNDQLTGAFSGKHPVIHRRRKVNVPKADAVTQTTPSLRRTQSRK